MTSPLCWDNEARTSVSGYYLDPSIDFAISGDVAHAFDPRPVAGQLWALEADRAALVEQSAKALHVAWPTRGAHLWRSCFCGRCVERRISSGTPWVAA